jgi:hypothetical protein
LHLSDLDTPDSDVLPHTPTVNSIPTGSVVLTYPFPRGVGHDEPILWQIEEGLQYRLPGGYIVADERKHRATIEGVHSVTEALLEEAYSGKSLALPSQAEVSAVTNNLRTWNIDTIVVTGQGRGPASVDRLFTVVLGRPPMQIDGVDVWYQVISQLGSASGAPGITK